MSPNELALQEFHEGHFREKLSEILKPPHGPPSMEYRAAAAKSLLEASASIYAATCFGRTIGRDELRKASLRLHLAAVDAFEAEVNRITEEWREQARRAGQ